MKYSVAFIRALLVLIAALLGLGILFLIQHRKELTSIVRASKLAHQMPGWSEMGFKYSAPFATFEQKIGTNSQALRIGVRLRRRDLLNYATWLVDLEDGKPTETWITFDQEFSRAREVISHEKWLADWKSQGHGRSIELWVQGGRSRPILKGTENMMNHVWEQFGLTGAPRFYVLARRSGGSWIELTLNQDGSEAVADEYVEKTSKELSPHWLDHLHSGTWSEAGSKVINHQLTASAQMVDRMHEFISDA